MPFDVNDPKTFALMQLASGLMAGGAPSYGPPKNFLGVLGGAGPGALHSFMVAKQQQEMDEYRKLVNRKLRGELDNPPPPGLMNVPAGGSIFDPSTRQPVFTAPNPQRPMVVGDALIDPANPQQPLYKAPDKPQPTPSNIREYEYARGQGYKGTFQDFVTEQKNAGANKSITNVNAFTPASEAAQTEFMKSTRTNYEAVRNAPSVLKNIEEAKALIPSAKGFMGPGGETLLEASKFLNNRLGMSIDTQGVKDAEELRSRVFFQLMENLKKMDAQPSQMQQIMMRDALGKLGTDPNALGAVLDAYGSVVRDKVAIHNREVRGAQERGVKFPYDPMIELRQGTKPQGPPKKGDVVEGWEFVGGDPSNKMNWRKK